MARREIYLGYSATLISQPDTLLLVNHEATVTAMRAKLREQILRETAPTVEVVFDDLGGGRVQGRLVVTVNA